MKAIKAIIENGKIVLAEPLPEIPGKLSALVFIASENEELPDTGHKIEKAFQDWLATPDSSREDLLFQTQSVAYKQWMQEDEWDTETPSLPISDFKPRAEQ